MAGLTLRDVKKSYGATQVMHGVDLDIEDGEFVVFVGPSGCGKSTLLRMIAGLEKISGGTLEIDGVRVNDFPPSLRGIAMVFQSYALYPHKDVRGNLGFALKHAGVDKHEIDKRVNNASEILGLSEMMDRKPRELSGGQRQRVAIGRAIVREPDVFLFDEPLSNLDAALRVHMRVEILKLHQRLKNTMVYVTHDQTEAMTLADRIVVLRDGRVEQVGTPLELYKNPVNTFVAGFIGSPAMNFLEATVQNNRVNVDGASICNMGVKDGPVKLGVRPEHLTVSASGVFKGRVSVFEHLGGESFVHLTLADNQSLVAKLDGEHIFKLGDECVLDVKDEYCHVFDPTGNKITS